MPAYVSACTHKSAQHRYQDSLGCARNIAAWIVWPSILKNNDIGISMILVGRSLFLSVEVGTILMRLAANSRFFCHVFGQPESATPTSDTSHTTALLPTALLRLKEAQAKCGILHSAMDLEALLNGKRQGVQKRPASQRACKRPAAGPAGSSHPDRELELGSQLLHSPW